jgi:hypothetical protein
MELFSQAILDALEVFQSEHARGPTVSELATNLGIPFGRGRNRLAERVQRQIVLGRVSQCRGRFTLTSAGRRAIERPVIHITPAGLGHGRSQTVRASVSR